MKKIWILAVFFLLFGCSKSDKLRTGDIIFHTSRSSQSRALQLATHSPYSHMGMIVRRGDKLYVFEASTVVRFVPLSEWISHGVNEKYKVKRLKNESLLTATVVSKLLETAKGYEGKPYDLYFEWTDDRIYCSELVWKIYKRVLGIEIGKVQTMGEFDFSHPEVKKKLRERFGDKVPLSEQVISPAAMFESKLLKDINQ